MADETKKDIHTASAGEQVLTTSFPVPTEKTLIDLANDAALRLEAANLKSQELIKRQEEIHAKMLLGGRSSAGTQIQNETEEEKNKREANLWIEKAGLKLRI